VAVDDALV